VTTFPIYLHMYLSHSFMLTLLHMTTILKAILFHYLLLYLVWLT